MLTENWFDVTATSASGHAILYPLDGRVKLLIDLANWGGESKYRSLAEIASYEVICQAKAQWGARGVGEADFRRSLDAVVGSGYAVPLALVCDAYGVGEWDGLARLGEIAMDQPTDR
ncbi:hypothetical protein [Glutamicibacter sp. NPDC090743]|uniref:hypothetical protein n=1 Tax=Glutamicibacter sp. NPDC090743 TaxID=3364001 RepID=UPI0038014248